MKRRSYEELKGIYDIIKNYSSGYGLKRGCSVISMIVRNSNCVLSRLYPDMKINYDTHMNECGEFDEIEEYEEEVSPLFSTIVDNILYYYNKSPYWDVAYGAFGTYEDCEVDEEVSPAREVMEDILSYYEDEELIDTDNELLKTMEMEYEDWRGVGDNLGTGYVIIRSVLYPYVKELKKCSAEEDRQMVDCLEKAFLIIEDWMEQGVCCKAVTKKAGYFFSEGGVLYDDGFSSYTDLGVCDYSYGVVIAAELIESIVFSLNRKYHVLPEWILSLEGKEKTV